MINHYEQEPHAHFPNAVLDEFIVMPNHVHGIVFIVDNSSKSKRNTGSVGAENLQPCSIDDAISYVRELG